MCRKYNSTAKQTFVAKEHPDDNTTEMLKVCQWYGPNDKTWLWDGYWGFSFFIYTTCMIAGLFGVCTIGMASCYSLTPRVKKWTTILFGLIAVLNVSPLTLYWSRICGEESICNETESYCVNSCQMGSGSWHIFAASFMWVSAMITTWAIKPFSVSKRINKERDPENPTSNYISPRKAKIHPTGSDVVRVDDKDPKAEHDGKDEEMNDTYDATANKNASQQYSSFRGRFSKAWIKITRSSSDDSDDAEPMDQTRDEGNNFEATITTRQENEESEASYRKATCLSTLVPPGKSIGWESIDDTQSISPDSAL